jgi:hypothetical protein
MTRKAVMQDGVRQPRARKSATVRKPRAKKASKPPAPTSSCWTANDWIRVMVGIPASLGFLAFVLVVLWFVYARIIDPTLLGTFAQKAAQAGFSGNGMLGLGALIVVVLVAVLRAGRLA